MFAAQNLFLSVESLGIEDYQYNILALVKPNPMTSN